jgi:tetratricopeptide (TPR) repeat protein
VWLRLGLVLVALVILIAAAWFYPPQIRAGARLMSLRAAIGAAKEQENTGVARKTQALYCVDQAKTILRDLPDSERALYYHAAYQQVLSAAIGRELAGTKVTSEQGAQVLEEVFASRAAARQLCQDLPVAGYYQALYAQELNFSAWYDESVAIPTVVHAFETAHANHPNVPQVTWMCLRAFSEILAVDRDELPASDLERVEQLVGAMGTALLEQQPERSAEVLQQLQRVFPEPDRLIAVTPRRLLCYEALYELFFRQGRYEQCAQLLDAMDRLNRERHTRQDAQELTLYELTRTPPQSREEKAAALARRRLVLAGASGADEHYTELRQAETAARYALSQPILVRARDGAAAGDYYRALRHARMAVSRFPEVSEAHALLAGWLLTVGERKRALDALGVLLGMPEPSRQALDQGVTVAERLQTDRRGSDEAALLADVLRVRQACERARASRPNGKPSGIGDAPPRALHGSVAHPGSANSAELSALRERLTAWARGGAVRTTAAARFGHLALFHAGCAAELAGDLPGAAELYQEALASCPLHRPSVEQLLGLPEEVAGEAQKRIRVQFEAAGFPTASLRRELVVPMRGVVLRHLAVEPPEIGPTQAVSLVAAIEITAELSARPTLSLTFGCADGSSFLSSIGAKQWLEAQNTMPDGDGKDPARHSGVGSPGPAEPGAPTARRTPLVSPSSPADRGARSRGAGTPEATIPPRLGQLLLAKVELVPAIAALQAGHGLPDGPVTLRIPGAERDAGFAFHHPAFVVQRPDPPP